MLARSAELAPDHTVTIRPALVANDFFNTIDPEPPSPYRSASLQAE
jgi:hypothetical protein